ncbi:peptidase associated/transthyretin-like domain-containing protein [Haloflavibacter putidus]|uniref:CarboxypepD_reg-like domain-containing protein n=1 Tax=Haloflavibacter putidus TaxID=2576776 RepID=A0A507ZVW1_9FLAO|nr:hypothetical protein [Haloflavibacter putidus]TQD37732.1 hypothetical protein FKR84_09675 [Haloflavibacter putidus]
MRHFYCIFILLFTGFSVWSQNNFKGYIIADSIAYTQVNIVNLNQKTGVVNNKKGKFSIQARAGDSLVFSSVQYEAHAIKVQPNQLNKTNYIYLYPLVNKLEEVQLSNIQLSGDLTQDAKKIDTYVFDPTKFGLPVNTGKVRTIEEKRLYTAQTGGAIGVLIDVISGRMKMLERQVEYQKLENLIRKARQKLGDNFFTESLAVKPEKIDDFLYFLEKTDATFAHKTKNLNNLEWIEYLKSKLTAFHNFTE